MSSMKLHFAIALAAVFICGCSESSITGGSGEDVSALATRVEELEEAMENIRAAIDKAQSACDDLDGAVSAFDYDDWRDVVPRVRSAKDDLESALSEAELASMAP